MSPRTSLPAPQTLLPHRPPMLLLEEILRWEPGRIVCRAELGPDHPFLAPGGAGAPSALCAELLAQAAGLEHGLGLPQGVEPQAGLLVRIASLLLHAH
ncbi:MAG: hypothetical protein OEY14_16085, partial [Myxococcales bacterium]|nr:hypothetical protein [Myxococcales bacterium]